MSLAMAMAASTVAQFLISTLSPFIIDDFGLSRTQFGLLTAVVFFMGGVGSPFIGHIVDRMGGEKTIAMLFAFAAAGWIAIAIAPSFTWLVIAAAIAGVAGGFGNPVTNDLVMRHVPAQKQGLVMGIKQSGPQLAAILTGLLFPFGAGELGWRWLPAILTAAVAALAIPRVVKFSRWAPASDEGRPPRSDQHEKVGRLSPAERLTVRWMTGYALFIGIGISAVVSYVPLYAFELGYDEHLAGTTVLCIGMVGLPSLVWAGQAATKWKTVSQPLSLFAAGATVFTALFLAAARESSWLVWVASMGFALTAVPWHVVGMVGVIRHVGVGRAGKASGIVLLGFNAGLVMSPIAFGWTVDATGSYTAGWLGTSAAFGVAAAIGLCWHLQVSRGGTRASAGSLVITAPGEPDSITQSITRRNPT